MRISIVAALLAVSTVSMAQSKKIEPRTKDGESVVIAVGECSRAEKKVGSGNQVIFESKFAYRLCNQKIAYKVEVIEGSGMTWPKENEIPGTQVSSYSTADREKVYSQPYQVEAPVPAVKTDSLGRVIPAPTVAPVPSESQQAAIVRGMCEQSRDSYKAQIQKVAVPECAQ